MLFTDGIRVLAQAAGGAPAGGGMGAMGQFLIFIPILGIMYFLMIRPQQQKQKQQAEMLKRLKVGDKVRTVGGILGTIKYVSEQTVKLEVAPNTVIEFLRGAVDKVMEDTAAEASKKDDKKDDTKKEKEGDEYKK
ncbi:MAG: preprotein translocase subunit YajC [Victivallales bacterium]|nr:preprotein translocase subunit YajC [Victivallales bacterium]MBR5026867.1 preprotein translocase subunit YajC [Victivallales bacterium]MCR5381284.1 preprotein translocase subunit YajC [Lentisphaeria bacterium]